MRGLLSAELAARLQSVGSRVRKHVTEGYATTRFSTACSTTSSPVTQTSLLPPPVGPTYFRSANDTLRDVLSGGVSCDVSSARKRSRDDADVHDAEMADVRGSFDDSVRVVKPLRRQFKQTRSLPVGLMRWGQGSTAPMSADIPTVEETGVEDDWSNSFGPENSDKDVFKPKDF
ncbi:hypothetical protein PLICRDRAFT_33493 [Plicaturopsis crispa FD-325 SS-3]|nr:hypothetical protein PLICRDRAFT_33493 [Plicaturopsis crispa FD-325 SS-3]